MDATVAERLVVAATSEALLSTDWGATMDLVDACAHQPEKCVARGGGGDVRARPTAAARSL